VWTMSHFSSLVLAVAVTAGALLAPVGASAGTEVTVNIGLPAPPTIVLPAPPRVVVVPDSPVYYAPDVDANLFVYEKRYYTVHDGHWFWARSHRGPWTVVAMDRVPGPVRAVPVKYYKVPPGHAKKFDGGHPGKGHGKGKGRD
jgi:hypothetical protein